jgi:hypothetical protein
MQMRTLTPGLTEDEIVDRACAPPARITGEYIVLYVLAVSAFLTILSVLW